MTTKTWKHEQEAGRRMRLEGKTIAKKLRTRNRSFNLLERAEGNV